MGWFDAGPDAWLLTMACWTNTSLYSIVLTNTLNTNSQWPTLFTVVICSIQIQIHPMHHYPLALPSLIHSTKENCCNVKLFVRVEIEYYGGGKVATD